MIKDRIIQIIEYKKISKEIFFTKIGMTSANFRGKAKETPINSTAIENILSEIPDVNPEWLLTGKGKMLRGEGEVLPKKEENPNLIDIIKQQAEQIGELKSENKRKNEMFTELKSEIEQLKNKIRRLQSGADERSHTTDQMQELPHVPTRLANPHLILHEQDNPQ
jgi:predicted RNase H-like nuclease (RuvC/YqgF family)